jgi:hypothetical protein
MTTITAASFPTPDIALRSAAEDEVRRVRRFAHEQARTAAAALPGLADELSTARSRQDRVTAFTRVFQDLTEWRAGLADRMVGHVDIGLAHDPSRYTTTIEAGGANYDRIGYIGRLREGAVWDPASRTYRGGRDTPAHLILVEYGRVATARFAAEEHDGDTLRNWVTLPDDTRLEGNRLVRGEAARRIAADLLARVAARGLDTSRIETGGDPMFAITAPDRNRERMFRTAMTVLADATYGDIGAWQTARYLLYQAPRIKKGSDAVTRTFLVAVGTLLLGRPPVLAQDVDLRCMVAGQQAATTMPGDPQSAW